MTTMRWLAMPLMVGLTLTGMSSPRAETLFDKLGGMPGLTRLAHAATDRFQADKRVADQFDNLNMVRFRQKLAEHLCAITGGGCTYTGRPMHAAHEGLNLRTAQFNAVAEDVQDAMQSIGIPYHVQNQLIALLAPMHRDVVTR